jgi:hypothetical protein
LVLQREAQDATRRRVAFPRNEPDYFKRTPVAVDQADLLKALERRISPDPRIDAYIKTQLLSGVERFDEAHARAAISAFISAPALIPLPGLTQRELQPWAERASRATEADLEKINDAWEQERAPYIAANEPITRYRDLLRQRIAVSDALRPMLLRARLEDLSQRAAVGLEVDKELTALAGDMQAWTTTAPRAAVAEMAGFAQEYAKRTGPTTNDKLAWNERSHRAIWRTRKAQLNANRLEKLIEALEAAAKRAAG